MMQHSVQPMLDFIAASPSCYHVIANTAAELTAAGYAPLSERERWTLKPGGRYFVTRNSSSLIAFRVPETLTGGFMMAAAHSDSPTFKLKEHAELRSNGYVRLNTEKYGGMLMATWFDRPLSVAGRLFVREGGGIAEKLVDIDRDLLVIPSVAIHMNRNANDGMKYQANVDTVPLFSAEDPDAAILSMAAEAAGVRPEDVLGQDLFLYCRGRGTVLGAHGEYILSPKLDDLACAWGCTQGFLASGDSGSLPVLCIFDNEEVGSATKQGAASTFLRDTLRRISLALGQDEESFQTTLARSFLVSADNAHAVHPDHPEYADADNCPRMNEGVVIKFNAKDEAAAKRYAEIAEHISLAGNSTEELVDSLIAELRSMNDKLNIPQSIQNYGAGGVKAETSIIDETEFLDKLPEVAANAIADACTGSNPRIPSQEEMEQLLKACYYDLAVDF